MLRLARLGGVPSTKSQAVKATWLPFQCHFRTSGSASFNEGSIAKALARKLWSDSFSDCCPSVSDIDVVLAVLVVLAVACSSVIGRSASYGSTFAISESMVGEQHHMASAMVDFCRASRRR